ncbi:hypothetical protein [Hathewaya massiliensis]|uniref:hypothetical protein n=1 Tax=Hathewaya massiliensis TaxID=1964382 RepID=UPI001158604C|nr:hypothetical protein [Hathewaya massiliensis]
MNKKTLKRVAIIGAALGYYIFSKQCNNKSCEDLCSHSEDCCQCDDCCDGFMQIPNSKEV